VEETKNPENTENTENTESLIDMVSRIAKAVPDSEWDRIRTDLSKNVDHYLYGSKKLTE
jgi:hypothetical protein